jgi:hypothetical protein
MAAKLMSPAQVEEEFGLPQRYQEDLRARKLIPYFKLGGGRGGKVMYDRTDVEQFLAAHRVPGQVEDGLEAAGERRRKR